MSDSRDSTEENTEELAPTSKSLPGLSELLPVGVFPFAMNRLYQLWTPSFDAQEVSAEDVDIEALITFYNNFVTSIKNTLDIYYRSMGIPPEDASRIQVMRKMVTMLSVDGTPILEVLDEDSVSDLQIELHPDSLEAKCQSAVTGFQALVTAIDWAKTTHTPLSSELVKTYLEHALGTYYRCTLESVYTHVARDFNSEVDSQAIDSVRGKLLTLLNDLSAKELVDHYAGLYKWLNNIWPTQTWIVNDLSADTQTLTLKKIQQMDILYDFYWRVTTRFIADDYVVTRNNTPTSFTRSLRSFYKDGIHILCNDQINEQDKRTALASSAERHFKHRNNILRGVADVVMVLSVIGLLVGAARVALGNTFFFSTAPTKRHTDLAKLMEHQGAEDDVLHAPSPTL